MKMMLVLMRLKKSEIIFLEGYLWDEGEPRKAFEKAINNSNKVAMSLSDLFCVERHKLHFLDLVKNKLDITFANEQEIMSLINVKKFEDVINYSMKISCSKEITSSCKIYNIKILVNTSFNNFITMNCNCSFLTSCYNY